MKIGIIGYGVVGKAIKNTLSQKYPIIKYDKFEDYNDFKDLIACEFIFISVPTPFDCKANKVDDSAVVESLERLQAHGYENIVLIKSTLPPGSCDRYLKSFNFDIVFNPEFLRESTTPNEDFATQDTVVIGTPEIRTFKIIKKMFKEVLIPEVTYFHTTAIEAEMIKCAQNTMLASRVAIANIIYDSCLQNNINYDNIKRISFDRFEIIGPYMTSVPGPDGQRGFGGKCLPKDIRAFNTISQSDLLENLIAYNDSLRDDLSNFLYNFNPNKD